MSQSGSVFFFDNRDQHQVTKYQTITLGCRQYGLKTGGRRIFLKRNL